jgi:CTP:molybdopterin cytidylyltransferase MocA
MTPMQPDHPVAAVILAAGASSRFGSPKPLARVGSRTMLGVVADVATAAGLEPVLVVAPSGLRTPQTVTVVPNDAPELGMSRSLRLGLAAVPPDRDAAIVLLADQPSIDVALLQRLLGSRGAASVVATAADGRTGPPVLLERDAFDLADAASGDVGLRDWLRSNADLVTAIDLADPLPDVDDPSDLERITEPCAGCGARFLPQVIDETHPYIGASPACWAAFGELLAREFESPAYGRIHRHTVDVYAVQHPGTDDRRQRQSVALHLVALCHWLEHGIETARLNAISQRLAGAPRRWPWLDPPSAYPMTVLDVLSARDAEEHVELVRRWGESTWKAWSVHQPLVREWAREASA